MSGKFSRGPDGQRRDPNKPLTSADYIRSGQIPPRKKHRYQKKRSPNPKFILLCVLTLLLVVLLVCCGRLPGDAPEAPEETKKPDKGNAWFGSKETEAPTEAPTQPPMEITHTATISATGDVLMHLPVINSCYDSASGSYDFMEIFQYLDDYAAKADYAVANLETTLAGSGNGYSYSGYPCFNCPDNIAKTLKDSGFDMLLTANNHCYDTNTVGLSRTLEVATEHGLDTLGTQSGAEDADYTVQIINGIQVGMMCYSYATSDSYPDRPSLNGILVRTEDTQKVSYFDYDQLDLFYGNVASQIADMEAAGAEAIVLYIHWGQEYQLSPNDSQTTIAQKLCDLGVDVIVGGHPHVIQPEQLLTSTVDDAHKTVCLYSMGNAISNQQRQNMNLKSGHTEDGLLFSFTFARYTDGEVMLDSVGILPTWVCMSSTNSGRDYRILPLDPAVTDWAAAYGVSASTAESAQASYDRTMELVGAGLSASQDYLSAQREAKLATTVE